MSAPRGTTPTLVLKFTEPSLDLTVAANVYVTFRYGSNQLTKTGADLTIAPKTISVSLSQEETLQFPEGIISIQANWTGSDGFRAASEIANFTWSKQLLNEVLT